MIAMQLASRSQLRMSFLRYALWTVPLLVLLGSVSGRLANSSQGNPWFDALEKPAAMPAGWVFGAVWMILYVLLGLALALILHARGARGRPPAVSIFLAQLALNYAWSPVFFALHRIDAAFAMIVLMFGLSVAAAWLFWGIRRGAALLMLPYLGWLAFAAWLTWEVDRINPGAEQVASPGASAEIRL